MTIAICGSMSFAKEILVIRDQLTKLGFTVTVPRDAEMFAENPARLDEKWHKAEPDLILQYLDEIRQCDSIFILNMNKGSIANYVGGYAFLSMGFAHILKKKIYLYNPIPDLPYRDEMTAMQPIILNGDLSFIHGQA